MVRAILCYVALFNYVVVSLAELLMSDFLHTCMYVSLCELYNIVVFMISV